MHISGKKQPVNKRNNTQIFVSLLLITSPWIVLFVTTRLLFHHSVFNSVPCWSDELSYWHEVLSFSQKGFNFGYYTINEVLPHYLSFGSHGFGTVSMYALFAKIFGWKAYSLVLANTFILSVAFLAFTLLVRTSSLNLVIILFFTLTFAPLVLFSPTSMSELLNLSLMIIYVGILHRYFRNEGKKWLILFLIFCTAISFIRIIYIILFLPVLFKRKNEFRFDSKFLFSVIIWITFSGILFVINNLFVSPYPDSFLSDLFKSHGFVSFMSNFTIHFVQNLWNFINPLSENMIQVLQRYFVILVCLYSLIKSNLLQTKHKKLEIEYFIVFLILFLFLFITIAAYDVFDWRDYRVLAPVLYGCMLYLLLIQRDKIVYSLIGMNILGIVFMLISPQVLESFNNGRYDKPVKNTLLSGIEYTDYPRSGFENTIVVNQFDTNTVMNIPAGIGISFSEILSDTLKSNYVYSKNKLKLTTYKLINSNTSGYLYRKLK